jgi:hypothetical protein
MSTTCSRWIRKNSVRLGRRTGTVVRTLDLDVGQRADPKRLGIERVGRPVRDDGLEIWACLPSCGVASARRLKVLDELGDRGLGY